jgi:ligand-binding sensor domain-containing protein/signal transduction histidine kinase/DNA-binding response OmpR family regulator
LFKERLLSAVFLFILHLRVQLPKSFYLLKGKPNLMIRLIPLICLLIVATRSEAQVVHLLNLKNGLSNNYVQCIGQDQLGYMWIGTRDGLNRFDGDRVVIFREQLPSSFIYCLMSHSSGKLWIGTSQGGISIYDPRTESFQVLSDRRPFSILRNKDVYSLVEDSHHNVWIASLQGLGKIPSGTDTLLWFEKNAAGFTFSVTSALETKNGNILIGTNAGIFRVNNDQSLNLARESIIPENVMVRSIIQDKKGELWFSTDAHGVYRYNETTNTIQQYHPGNQPGKNTSVWNLFQDRRGKLFAGLINDGIFWFDESKNDFVRMTTPTEKLNSESITSIANDNAGNMWIGSHGAGVCFFQPGHYVFEKYLNTYDANNKTTIVSTFLEDTNGMWIGTDGDGIKFQDKKNNLHSAYSVKSGLSSNTVLTIASDTRNKWVGTWQGGVNYIDERGKITRLASSDDQNTILLNSNIKSLMMDSLSRLWIVTHGDGFFVLDIRTKQFVDPGTINKAYHKDVAKWGSTILQRKNGEIWLGSHSGLFQFRKNNLKEFHADGSPNALASSLIYTLFEDSKGQAWVGTSKSLEKYNEVTKSFENYSKKFGIPPNVKCILEDHNKNLWISTANEIIRFNEETKSVEHFDTGFNAQEGQYFECSCVKRSDGKLFFGGTEGFNSFWPDSVNEITSTPALHITNLSLFNKIEQPTGKVLAESMPFTEKISLRHDQNLVTFEFVAIEFMRPKKALYSYLMEGFNHEWSPVSSSNTATYTNLNPGHYVFRVRNVSTTGKILAETSTIVEIIPPFWTTIWFKALVVLTVLMLFATFMWYRLQYSRRQRLLLSAMVRERTKEINNKNTLLSQQAEELKVKNESLIEQERKILEQALTVSVQRDQLQETNAALHASLNTKDTLFSIIAHDLKNPFTSVLGNTHVLYSEYTRYSDQERKELLHKIYDSSSGIYALLENLLVWSKAQQNLFVYQPQRLSFNNFVSDHFQFISSPAEKKALTLHNASNEDVSFDADPDMLSIVFRNLLSNALKFSPQGGRIRVGYTLSNSMLELYIEDEGPGLENPQNVFDNRVGLQQDHRHGLGLTLCREFVDMHGGKILATNNSGSGARFSFTLPMSNPLIITEGDTMQEHPSTRSLEEGPGPALKNGHPTILIAEDDDEVRYYLSQALRHDFDIKEASDGEQGWKLAMDLSPDLIISDLNMPRMDGLDLCSLAKSRSETSHIPFIMLTAEMGTGKKIVGFEKGADDFIIKPVDANVLRARVTNLLDSRKKLKAIYRKDITVEAEQFTTNPLDEEFIRKLNENILGRISDAELNPDSLAVAMHMSRTGLYMKVKALTGESVSIYIRNVRLKEAKKMLLERRRNVTEIAYAVGFNQVSYFTSCFKQAFSITPTDFANIHR